MESNINALNYEKARIHLVEKQELAKCLSNRKVLNTLFPKETMFGIDFNKATYIPFEYMAVSKLIKDAINKAISKTPNFKENLDDELRKNFKIKKALGNKS